MIAIALSCRPKVLIADEPTKSLDVTIQAQILRLMQALRNDIETTILFVTSDLGIVAEMADRVAIMYAGQVIEICDVFKLFTNPAHPYTKGIMKSIQALKSGERLNIIPGDPPNLMALPSGCTFHPRCDYCQEKCKAEAPHYEDVSGNGTHMVRCHFPLGLGATPPEGKEE
jgi:oligopeptide/dipeptide ABC transporter ATP-binding protein